MSTRPAGSPPLRYARVAGLLYLVLFFLGPFSIAYVPSVLVAPGDPAATAKNIMTTEWLFRLGIVSDAVIFLCEIALSVLLYVLLKPVSATLSLTAAFARLANAVVQGINLLNSFIVLLLLGGTVFSTAFQPDQLNALVMLFLNAHRSGILIWQAFFALHCFLLGYLLFKSGYFPKTIGVLMVCASLGYFIDSFGNFSFPAYKETYAWIVGPPAVIGELALTLWLLFKGVNVKRWNDRMAVPS